MKIEDFGGISECLDINDLENGLNKRYRSDVNEFWLYGKNRYPCLAIMVNNQNAYLHYFPKDKHPGFQSVGIDTNLKSGELSFFYTNSIDEEIAVANDAVVSFSTAIIAAKEFFSSMGMPNSIKWFEL